MGLIALAMLASATTSAQAQSWNMYSSYTDTVTLRFLDTIDLPVKPGKFPALHATFRAGTSSEREVRVTMDTGSTGMIISHDHIDTRGLEALGPGTTTYTSDGTVLHGTFYNVPVKITGKDADQQPAR